MALMARSRGLAILDPVSPHTRGASLEVAMAAEDMGAVAMVAEAVAAGAGTDHQAGIRQDLCGSALGGLA